MLFLFNPAFQTIFIYTFVLFLFVILPLKYRKVSITFSQNTYNSHFLADGRLLTICVIFSVVFGFRYDYLHDWISYSDYFDYIRRGYENDGWREPGFYAIVKFLCYWGGNVYSLFIIECFLWIYSICYIFKDHRQYLWIILPMIFLRTTLVLDISRQFFALSFLLISFKNYWSKNNTKAIIFAIISILIHYSTICIIPFLAFFKSIKTVKAGYVYILFAILTFFSAAFFDRIIELSAAISIIIDSVANVGAYDADRLLSYQDEAIVPTIGQILTLSLMRCLYIILYFHCQKKRLIDDLYINNLTLIGLIGMLIGILMGYNMILSRFASFFTIFTNIGWGIFVHTLLYKSSKNRVLIFCLMLVLIYQLGGFYSNIISSFSLKDVNPYLIYK